MENDDEDEDEDETMTMTQPDLVRKLRERVTDYLKGGGLFNPEMAEHERVRELLIDCHVALMGLELSPSTPIVPSTPDDPRFNGVVVEVAEEFAILEEDIPRLRGILAGLRPAAGLSAEQVEDVLCDGSVYDINDDLDSGKLADRLNALLAAKPGEDVFETNRKLRFALDTAKAEFTEFRKEVKQREAQIRKDALREAALFVESTDVDVVYRYTPFPHNDELTSKPLAELARRIRALAERPAPAGEAPTNDPSILIPAGQIIMRYGCGATAEGINPPATCPLHGISCAAGEVKGEK